MEKYFGKKVVIISLCIYGIFLPLLARADVEQPVFDTLTTDQMTFYGGWSQSLGTGLSGILTKAIFHLRLNRSPSYGPHFLLDINACNTSDYVGCSNIITWGFPGALVDPQGDSDRDSDTTLTDTNSGTEFSPSKYYSLHLYINPNANGAGTFKVYGSAADTYPNGSTDAGGLGDLAFKLIGIDRNETPTVDTSIPTTTPTTTTASTTVASTTTATATSSDDAPPNSHRSNVLFIPGMEGSRLYNGDAKVWEPSVLHGNDNEQELFLDIFGKSVDGTIHAKDDSIIDEAGGVDVYGSFMRSMDALKDSGLMKNWDSTPYDWRLSLRDVLNNGEDLFGNIFYEQPSNHPYIEQTLEQLASSSYTGKVTIIAHSNGGLVAKALMQKLGEQKTKDLIDKVIFVAVPQSGAPEALGEMLVGYQAGLPAKLPFVVSPVTARMFARNAPVAYHLLPSARYFSTDSASVHPVITFKGTHAFPKELGAYGASINTESELADFVIAKEGGRTEPDASDLASAIIGNTKLMSDAESAHDEIDSWTPPSGVKVYQIAGWGLNTVEGINFYEQSGLLGFLTNYRQLYKPNLAQDGDGVVPAASALMLPTSSDVRNYWLNLSSYAADMKDRRDHSNILGVPALQNLIGHILLGGSSDASKYISDLEPVNDTKKAVLQFFIHSPVSLHVYDADHNHTGIASDGSIEEKIPDSEYGEFGEVKYITVDGGSPYTLALQGKDTGTFTLDIQELEDGVVIATTTIADVPVTPETTATLSLSSLHDVSPLTVDEDGDNILDFSVTPLRDSIAYYVPAATAATTTIPSEQKVPPVFQQTSTMVHSSGSMAGTIESTDFVPVSTTTPNEQVATESYAPAETTSTVTETTSMVSRVSPTSSADLAGNPARLSVPPETTVSSSTQTASALLSLSGNMYAWLLRLMNIFYAALKELPRALDSPWQLPLQ